MIRVKTVKIPIATRASTLAQLVYINREDLQNLALRAALFTTVGMAGNMTITGGWGVLEFFVTKVWPIYQEAMSHA